MKTKLMSLMALLMLSFLGCSTTRIPKYLDNVHVDSYLQTGKARKCSEYTVIIKMGSDSVTYYTYYVDKYEWYRLK